MKIITKLALATTALGLVSFVPYHGPSDAGIGIPPSMAQAANVGTDGGVGINGSSSARGATAKTGDAAVISGQAQPTAKKQVGQLNNDANGGLNASNGETGRLPNGQPLKSGTPPGVGGNIDKYAGH